MFIVITFYQFIHQVQFSSNRMSLRFKKPEPMKFSEEQLAEFKKQFDEIDKDHNSLLDIEEVKEFLSKQEGGQPEFADFIMSLCDTDNDGLISFDDYLEFCRTSEESKQDQRNFIEALFKKLDTDNNGFLENDEIYEFACAFSPDAKPTREQINAQIAKLDHDNDGRLTLEEVIELVE